jgi:hypothetical protein
LTQRLKLLVEMKFKDDLLARLGICKDALSFCIGSLILPKQMLKDFQHKPEEKIKILNIYHYLYKFSLERLQKMLRQKEMALLMAYYLKAN